ncbi:MAG: glutamine-hydrolyzing carbamoyl-phosphate synthase small subunit [Chloroflexota bacterium]
MSDESSAVRWGALVLEDGACFVGKMFGADVESVAELVFNTGLTGYQEICTDPSYRGQMVVMTHPQIGNYGIADRVRESDRPWLSALIVRDAATEPHHWASQSTVHTYLADFGVPGLSEVDTRAITRRLRTKGTLRAVLTRVSHRQVTAQLQETLAERARAFTLPVLAGEVSGHTPAFATGSDGPHIAVIDCGVKWSILRQLELRGARVSAFPWDVAAETLLDSQPDGVLIANGPGDPALLDPPVRMATRILDKGLPLLGICLGHQIIARAAGGETTRLPFGHHGANHPVRDERSGKVYITSQNHEYQVAESPQLVDAGFQVSHRSLNDGSVEGLVHKQCPVRTVQFHPEGGPGPKDAAAIFDEFLALIRATAEGR